MPIKIQGIDASDLGLSLVLWISSCILMSILRSLFHISPYYYLISLVSLIVILIALKKASKQKHPTFLRSFISWLFIQPNQIEIQQPRIVQL